jgi:hypothetical protein
MKSNRIPGPEDRPFTSTLIIAILLIVIPAIALLSVHDIMLAEERMAASNSLTIP